MSTLTQVKAAIDAAPAVLAVATASILGNGVDRARATPGAYALSGGSNKGFAFNHDELSDSGAFYEGNANLRVRDMETTGSSYVSGVLYAGGLLMLADADSNNLSGPAISNVQRLLNHAVQMPKLQLNTVGNGYVQWSSGTLACATDIEIYFRDSAIKNTIDMSGGIALTDGQSAYVYLNPDSSVTVPVTIGTTLPTAQNAFRLCTRFGTNLVFFNGAVLIDGETARLGSDGSSTTAVGDSPVRRSSAGDFAAHDVTVNKLLAASGSGKGLDVVSAGDLYLGASVGANTLYLGGASSTVRAVGDLVVAGNLTVQGTTTTLNTATLDVEDTNVTVNKGGDNTSAQGAGLTVDRTGTKGSFVYDSTKATRFKIGDLASEVEIADISTAQALTNKTIVPGSNTISLTSAHILVGSGGGAAADVAMTGDVTIGNTGVTAIGSNKVTLGQMAQVATATFLGRTSSSTGNVEALTVTQATAMLNAFVGDGGGGGTKGLVPAPASGDAAAGKYLKADGSFSVPPGTGGTPIVDSKQLGNLGLSVTASGNILTIALKQADGATNPASGSGAVTVAMRDYTTKGKVNQRSVTSALSLAISSGTTLGFVASQLSTLYVYLVDTDGAGTMALAASSVLWDDTAPIDTFYPESGTTDQWYSNVADALDADSFGFAYPTNAAVQFTSVQSSGLALATNYYFSNLDTSPGIENVLLSIAPGGAQYTGGSTTTTLVTHVADGRMVVAQNTIQGGGSPFRLIGRVLFDAGLATPGLWITPTYVNVGNQVAAAGDSSIGARFHSYSSGIGTAGSPTQIVFTTRDYDTVGAMYGGTAYVVQQSGLYQVNASLLQSAGTTAVNTATDIQIRKNGNAYSEVKGYFSGATDTTSTTVPDTIQCSQFDVITIYAGNAGTSPSVTANAAANYVSIRRLGP